jgi:hypothetical protein
VVVGRYLIFCRNVGAFVDIIQLVILAFVATKLDVIKLVFKAFTRTSVAAASTVTPVRMTSDAEIEDPNPSCISSNCYR